MRGRGSFLATATVGLLLATLPGSAGAATIYTDTTADELADPGPGTGCSLREAIQAANTDGAYGGCFAGGPPGTDEGPDQIYLEPGAIYDRTLTGVEDLNATGDFDVRDENLQIAGFGATIQGDGTVVGDRVLHAVTGPMGFTVQLNTLTIRNGVTASVGGGLRVDSGALLVGFSTVTGNHAGNFGGGIESTATSTLLSVFNSTISDNTADADGGGIDAGGPFAQTGNVTITGNTADAENAGGGNGGGVFKAPGAGTFRIANTIVADNVDASMPGTQAPDCAGDGGFGGSGDAAFGYNLIGSTANCGYTTPGPGDILNMPAGLGPLQDNGGGTFTHALLPGSPAIDAGNPAGPAGPSEYCGASDQRGVGRPQGPRCDIGAFELIPIETPAVVNPPPTALTPPTPPAAKRKCKRKRAKRGADVARKKRCKRKRRPRV